MIIYIAIGIARGRCISSHISMLLLSLSLARSRALSLRLSVAFSLFLIFSRSLTYWTTCFLSRSFDHSLVVRACALSFCPLHMFSPSLVYALYLSHAPSRSPTTTPSPAPPILCAYIPTKLDFFCQCAHDSLGNP